MVGTLRYVIVVALLSLAKIPSVSAAQPILSCEVEAAQRLRRGTVTASLTEGTLVLQPLALSVENGGTLSILVSRVEGAQKIPVPTKLALGSRSVQGGISKATVSLELPIPVAERDQKIDAYLDALTAWARSRGETTRLSALEQTRPSVAETFRNIFVENQPGSYELTCEYKSDKEGFWKGTIRSELVAFTIASQGQFFDQPKFHLR